MLVLDAHTSAPNLKLPTALTGFRITLIQHIADDHTIREIATELDTTVDVLKNHFRVLRHALYCRSLAALVYKAGRHGLLRQVAGEQPALTRRHREVLRLHARGFAEPEIAHRLWLSPNTVHTHTSHARQRCGTRSVAAAINIAHSHGLLTSGCCDGTGGGCDWPDCPLRVSWKGQPE